MENQLGFCGIYSGYFIRLFAALICGFLLGLERKIRRHSVGIRTLVLISISSAMLGILSVYMAENNTVYGDPTRIAAAVVTGIGFIGAGAMIKQGLNVRGLTSAAIIFSAAAIGLACGAGLFIPAVTTLAISLLTLVFVEKMEHRLFPAEKLKSLRLEFSGTKPDEAAVSRLLKNSGLIVQDVDMICSPGKETVLIYSVKTPDGLDVLKLSEKLSEFTELKKISLSGKE